MALPWSVTPAWESLKLERTKVADCTFAKYVKNRKDPIEWWIQAKIPVASNVQIRKAGKSNSQSSKYFGVSDTSTFICTHKQ